MEVRTTIDWKEVVSASRQIIVEFVDRGVTPTVRTIFYALVSKQQLPNTTNAYKQLSRKLVEARKLGLIYWGWIADETRQILGGDYPYWDPNKYAEAYVDQVLKAYKEYRLPRWLNQPYYLEVWLEKFALAETIQTWLEDLNVVLVPSRGYSSWTFLKKAADRISYQLSSTNNSNLEKEAVILYLGDFDPAGVDIRRFLIEALEWFGIEVEVEHVAVTKKQIEEYKLPNRPEDQAEISKLLRDPRFKSWPYGLYRVELDALLAYVPDEFEKIVTETVLHYFDPEIWEEVKEQQAKNKQLVKDQILNLLKEKLENPE